MTKKDNILVLALKLFTICLVVALGLSALNYVTSPIISELTETKKAEAMQAVLPGCEMEKYSDSVYIGTDNGEINAIGTHEELLKNNVIYQEVYHTQNRVGGDK